MTLTIKQRANCCQHAITAYCDDDPYTNLVDWLADVMHWCDLNDHDFDHAMTTARMHFDAEVFEEALDGEAV